MQAFLDVKAGLSPAMFLDLLEGGLRMVQDCKPGGFDPAAFASRPIPVPPKRWVGPGGRTPHEQSYVEQAPNELKALVSQDQARSAALPIRQGARHEPP